MSALNDLLESFAEIKRVGEMDMPERLGYWEEKTRDQRRLDKVRENYTSIPGISDQLRLPRVGKIHLGIKKKTAKGVEYPSQTDYFVVSASDTTPEWAVNSFIDVYGEQPKELDIMFPLNDREVCFPQAYKRYSKAGLECKGNGVSAVETVNGKLVETTCDPDECEHFQAGNCHLRGHLQVMLPNVPGMGVWQIDTGSFNSVRNINSGLAFVSSLTGGRIAMIPLKLVIRPHKGRDPKTGKPTNNYVLDLANERIKMADVLKAATQAPAKVLMPWVDFDEEDAEIINNYALPGQVDEETGEIQAETLPPASPIVTPAQIKRMYAISKANKIGIDTVKAWLEEYCEGKSSKELTKEEYDQLCTAMEDGTMTAWWNAKEAIDADVVG